MKWVWWSICEMSRMGRRTLGLPDHHHWRCHEWRGWIVLPDDHGLVHVYPGRDLVQHTASEDCVCGPRMTVESFDDAPDGWIATHHSIDGREHTEQS